MNDHMTAPDLVSKLKEKEILAYAIAPDRVRLVVHLDISGEMVDQTINIFNKI
jgi:acetylornithine/succinyldiaminopimelate/putrescine aminotransferase